MNTIIMLYFSKFAFMKASDDIIPKLVEIKKKFTSMKANLDLIGTSEKINQIMSDDLDLIKTFQQYLEKRQELEQNFADDLSQFLKTAFHNNSSCSALIYDEIFSLLNHHANLASEIKSTFIPPIASFIAYMEKEKTRMNDSIKKASDSIKAFEKKIFIAHSHVERAQLDLLHFSSSKIDRSKRNVKLYEQELQNVENEQENHLKNLREVEYPNLFQTTSELDFSVRTTIKNSMLNLTCMEISSSTKLIDSFQTINSSSTRYEPLNETMAIAKLLGVSSTHRKMYAIVRCPYISEDVSDLSLNRGELIEVTYQHPSGWWEGECNGRRGLFPMTFVEMITDVESGALTIDECFEVDGIYIPVKPDEIRLDFGDIVFVSSLKDGWCEGYKVGTNEKGRFPAHIVRYVKQMRQWIHQDE